MSIPMLKCQLNILARKLQDLPTDIVELPIYMLMALTFIISLLCPYKVFIQDTEPKSIHMKTETPNADDAFKRNLRVINNSFNERIKDILSGDFSNKRPLRVGNPSVLLLRCGFPDIPIEISVSKLTEKMNQPNHPFSIVSVVHMPDCICNPIAVFQSVNKMKTKIILTDMTDKTDTNLVVAIELGRQVGGKMINDIRSVYPKDSINGVYSWIKEDLMEYCNIEKALDWVDKQPSNPAEVINLIKGFTNVWEINKSA